jgi:hypothetical protein
MFNTECIVRPSILNIVLPMDAMSNFGFVKFEDMSLLYNH